MRWLSRLGLLLRSLVRGRALDRELDDEIRYHLERAIDENLAAGMTPEQARQAALRDFGGVEVVKEECRDARGVNLVRDLVQDLRYGARMLRKSPGFTAVAVLTLALGIGANTAIFSFVDAILLRTIPVREPDGLVVLAWRAHVEPEVRSIVTHGDCSAIEGRVAGCVFSLPFFRELRAEPGPFAGVAGFTAAPPLLVVKNGAPSMGRAELVSGDYFAVLGVGATLGRVLGPEDDDQALPVAVLSHDHWQRAFGGDPGVVGRTLSLNGLAVTIVGVAEPSFTHLTPGRPFEMWLPLSMRPRLERRWDPRSDGAESWWLTIVARLGPDVPVAQAEAATSARYRHQVVAGASAAFSDDDDPAIALVPAPTGLTGSRGDYARELLALMTAVGILLAIACANVAGLLLARAAARRREMAVRLAMGAGRGRIIRQLLTESVMLAILGGALGALLATWGVEALVAFVAHGQSRPLGFAIAVDGRVLAFTTAVAIVVGIAFGLAPAFRGTRLELAAALRGESASTGAHRLGLGRGLVVAQVALSILVLVGAGLLVRTLANLRGVEPGFRTENVLLFDLDAGLAGYQDAQMDALHLELRNELAALPGVTAATFSNVRPLSGGQWRATLRRAAAPGGADMGTDVLRVGPGFLETLQIPLRAGRTLSATDLAEAAGTVPALVNEAFVRRHFEGSSPIGERLRHKGDDPGPTFQIVGIVGDTRYDQLRRDLEPTIYLPARGSAVTFELHAAADPTLLVPAVRAAVQRLDARLPLVAVRTQSEEVERLLFKERLMARLSSLFAVLALALASIGLYALLSYEVERRARELGIRMALGAQRGQVLRMVVRQGLGMTVTGIALGVAGALAVARYLQSLLYGVGPTDPLVFAGVAVLLVAVALLACYLPARRATRVDPMAALRCE